MKLLVLILTFALSVGAFANIPVLPKSWFVQNSDKSFDQRVEDLPMPDSDSELAIDRVFDVQHKTLKKLNRNQNRKWKITDYVFMLALSKSGLLGFKALSGKGVFQVYYAKKNKNKSLDVVDDKADLYINANMDENDLKDQVKPIVNSLIATGRISNNSRLTGKIVKKIQSMQKVVGTLDSSTNKKFFLNGFEVGLGINRSGGLLTWWAAQTGAEVVLRLKWARVKKKSNNKFMKRTPGEQELNTSFTKFVNAMITDLDKVDESPLAKSKKKAVKVRFALGVTTTNTIIISSSKTSFFGHVYFGRNKKYKPTKSNIEKSNLESDYLYTIGKESSNKGLVDNIGRISSDKMIKGLNKAIKMGSYFVNKADKSKKWKVSMFRAWYIINISGFLGLSPLTGTEEIEFFYK